MTTNNNTEAAPQPNTFISTDGTIITYKTTGNGPGLILIHGVLSDASNYTTLTELLGKDFTVYAIERRGHGMSGPQGAGYGMIKECEDVAALQKLTGAHFLFGHSYGGLVALETARNNNAFTKIGVYDPAISIDGSIATSWMPEYQKYMAEKKYLDAFAIFSTTAGPENAQKTPLWLMKILLPLFIKKKERRKMYDLLPANLLEHKEVANKDNTYKNYQQITASVLLMRGGKSGLKWTTTAIRALAETLPVSETKEFPKLDHFGPDETGPEDVASALKEYFNRR